MPLNSVFPTFCQVEIRWEDIVQLEDENRTGKVYLFHIDMDDESDGESELANERSTPGNEVR